MKQMMKKGILPILTGVLLLLLVGCGAERADKDTASETDSEVTESQSENEEDSKGGIPENTQENAVLKGLDDCSFVAYEDETVKICVTETLTEHMDVEYAFYLDNKTDEAIEVYFSDIIINDGYMISPVYGMELEAQEIGFTQLGGGGEKIQTLTTRTLVRKPESGEEYEGDVYAEIPEDFKPFRLFLPCREAMAEKQVLVQNESMRISLIHFGQELSHDYRMRGYLQMVFKIENFESTEMPVKICGAKINGQSIEVLNSDNMLAGGCTCFLTCELDDYKFEDEGIEAISDVEVQILTSREEDGGVLVMKGGTWYPVTLSQKAEAKEMDRGETIYEDDMIRIGYLNYEENISSYDGYYTGDWNLIVENKSDMNLDISGTNYTIDGEVVEFFASKSAFLSCTVAAHAFCKAHVHYSNPAGDPPEIVKFNLNVEKQGGGDLVYTDGQEMTFVIP